VYGLDDALGTAIIAHSPPRKCNTALQRRIGDQAVGPQLFEEFLPPNYPFVVLYQIHQHREYLVVEPYYPLSSTEFFALHIQRIVPENVLHGPVLSSLTVPERLDHHPGPRVVSICPRSLGMSCK
jgi:hypothetical protein